LKSLSWIMQVILLNSQDVKVVEGGTAAEVKLDLKDDKEFCFIVQSIQQVVVENLVDSFIEVYEPSGLGTSCVDANSTVD
jgi:hypothetical protein